jgi:hypothetical protein
MGGAMATSPLAAASPFRPARLLHLYCLHRDCKSCYLVVLGSAPASHSERTKKSVLTGSRQALAHRANWGCAMSLASHFAAVMTLPGVWSIPMVAHVFKISPSPAGGPLLAFIPSEASPQTDESCIILSA